MTDSERVMEEMAYCVVPSDQYAYKVGWCHCLAYAPEVLALVSAAEEILTGNGFAGEHTEEQAEKLEAALSAWRKESE
jgi:hypothetical protein